MRWIIKWRSRQIRDVSNEVERIISGQGSSLEWIDTISQALSLRTFLQDMNVRLPFIEHWAELDPQEEPNIEVGGAAAKLVSIIR